MNWNNKYFLLRHGQTIYQKNGKLVSYDADNAQKLEITEEGRVMIKRVAEGLKNENINLIIASPFLRTRQSAEIASEVLGNKEINYDERLVDINIGTLHGKTFKEYESFFNNKEERFTKRPLNGESWNDVIERGKKFLNEMEKKYSGKNILIVSHADPIWIMANILLGSEKSEDFLATRGPLHGEPIIKVKNNLLPNVGELIHPDKYQ